MQPLIDLYYTRMKEKYPSMPENYIPKPKYTDRTANGLTKVITEWLAFNKCQVERVSNQGQYRDNKKVVTNIIGQQMTIGSGTWTPGQGKKGTADVHSIIKNRLGYGIPVKWEVKMKDKQSEHQKKYQQEVEQAGGRYFLVHNWDEFYKYYLEVTT